MVRKLLVFLLVSTSFAIAQDRLDADGEVLPAGISARLGSRLWRPTGFVWALDTNGDGSLIATLGDGKLTLFDGTTGHVIRIFEEPRGNARCVRIARDGARVAAAGCHSLKENQKEQDASIRVWTVASGKVEFVLQGHPGGTEDLAISADGSMLLSGGSDSVVRLWSLKSGELVREFKGHERGIRAVRVAEDGRRAVSLDWAGTATAWNLSQGTAIASLHAPHQIQGLAESADGRLLAIKGSFDEPLSAVDVETGEQTYVTEVKSQVIQLVMSAPLANRLVLEGEEDTLFVIDSNSGKLVRKLKAPGLVQTDTTQLTADGKMICIAGGFDVLGKVDVQTGTFTSSGGAIRAIRFSSDGKVVLSPDGQFVRLWDATTGRQLRAYQNTSPGGVLMADWLDDQKTVVAVTSQNSILTWDVATGSRSERAKVPTKYYTHGACLTANGTRLVVVEALQHAHVFDTATWQIVRNFDGCQCEGPGNLLALRDARRIAVSLWPTGTRVVDIAGEAKDFDFAGHTDVENKGSHEPVIRVMDDSRDGTMLVTAAFDPVVILWDLSRQTQIRKFNPASAHVSGLAISPDSSLLALGCWDGSIRIMEISTGLLLDEWNPGEGNISALAWSPDGRLAIGSMRGTALIADVQLGQFVAHQGSPVTSALEPAAAWDALGEAADVSRAAKAMRWFRERAELEQASVALLSLPKSDSKIADLIRDIDDEDSSTRDAATNHLRNIDAAPDLDAALKRGVSVEARARLSAILAEQEGPCPKPAAAVRRLRLVWLIQDMAREGSVSAREVLKNASEKSPYALVRKRAAIAIGR